LKIPKESPEADKLKIPKEEPEADKLKKDKRTNNYKAKD
jgi:hypothetical protein